MPRIGKNIYKRNDGRWEGRYAKGRDSNEKILYGSVYGKTCSEVKQRLASLISATPTNTLEAVNFIKCNLTFAELANQWLPIVSLKIKPSTYAGYVAMLNTHILPHLGSYQMQNITTANISSFAKEKLDAGRIDGAGGLSSKTVRDMLSVVKSIMDLAWSEKIISNRITVIYPKQQQQAMRVLSRQEQAALESVLTADLNIHKLGILLCLYTGIRVGELCALLWQDLSTDCDMLTVRQTLQRVKNLSDDGGKTKILIDTPKSQCSVRVIPIPSFLSPLMKSFNNGGAGYFMATPDSAFAEPRTMQNHFAKAVKAANIADANYHSLRHTFSTRCIEAGVDIKSLSEMLGHANVNITLNRYVHSSFEQKREGMKKLEQYIVSKS